MLVRYFVECFLIVGFKIFFLIFFSDSQLASALKLLDSHKELGHGSLSKEEFASCATVKPIMSTTKPKLNSVTN